MNVAGRHDAHLPRESELHEGVIAHAILRVAVVPDFHHETITEAFAPFIKNSARGPRAVCLESSRDRALATPGQDRPVRRAAHHVGRDDRHPFVASGQVAVREHGGQFAIPLGGTREHHEVITGGVRHAAALATVNTDFRPEDGG